MAGRILVVADAGTLVAVVGAAGLPSPEGADDVDIGAELIGQGVVPVTSWGMDLRQCEAAPCHRRAPTLSP